MLSLVYHDKLKMKKPDAAARNYVNDKVQMPKWINKLFRQAHKFQFSKAHTSVCTKHAKFSILQNNAVLELL